MFETEKNGANGGGDKEAERKLKSIGGGETQKQGGGDGGTRTGNTGKKS